MVLGLYNDAMVESLFLRPSAQATVMEFFPPAVFMPDTQIPVRSLGLRYIGWWPDS